MGGYGSGKRWETKEVTSSFLALDVRRLQRENLLGHRYSFKWQWSRNNEPAGNINIRPEADRLILSYRYRQSGEDWKSKEYAVQLERTCCHFGGERVWFRCPARGCGRRVAILYGGEIYACRRCHDLTYETQRQTAYDRAGSRVEAIRKRLKDEWGTIFDPAPPKPKGMHWKTYRRLAQMYEANREASLSGFAAHLGIYLGEAFGSY